MFVRVVTKLVKFCKQEDGPTAVEYAVMLALIITVCIGAITSLGGSANGIFGTVAAVFGSGSSGSGGSNGNGPPDSYGFSTGGTYNLYKDPGTGQITAYPSGATDVPSGLEPGWSGLTYSGGGDFKMNGSTFNGSGWAAGQ